jgi:hypothetical protein
MTKRIAICPKCSKFYELRPRQVEVWCQHIPVRKKFVDGKEEVITERLIPETDADVVMVKCRIVEIEG